MCPALNVAGGRVGMRRKGILVWKGNGGDIGRLKKCCKGTHEKMGLEERVFGYELGQWLDRESRRDCGITLE